MGKQATVGGAHFTVATPPVQSSEILASWLLQLQACHCKDERVGGAEDIAQLHTHSVAGLSSATSSLESLPSVTSDFSC